MKTTLALFIAIFAGMFLASCKTSSPTAPASDFGTPTAIGTPIGSPATATIDASGGTLISPDGRLEVIIPTGALSAATQLTVQAGTNEAPLGTGLAYSLTPHGQKFSKPITIVFHYDDSDRSGTDTRALCVATQKDDHIWYAFKNVTRDQSASTVAISTSHFSWYEMFDYLKLLPPQGSIHVNQRIALKVILSDFAAGAKTDPNDPNEYYAALNPWKEFSGGDLIDWSVNGGGTGSEVEGYVLKGAHASAEYVAPASTKNLQPNPVTVTATIQSPEPPGNPLIPDPQLQLISNIKVLDSSGVKVYKIDMVFTGTDMNDVVDVKHGYSQHASFMATVYPDRDTIVYDGIENFNGQISGWTERYHTCIHTATSQGDLMHITGFMKDLEYQSVITGQIRIFPHVLTSQTGISFTTDCGQGPKQTTGTKYEPVGYAPGALFILDGTKQTLTDPTAPNQTGVTVTFTLTPQ